MTSWSGSTPSSKVLTYREVSLVAILDADMKGFFVMNAASFNHWSAACVIVRVTSSCVDTMTQVYAKPSMKQPVVGKSRWFIMKSMVLSTNYQEGTVTICPAVAMMKRI